MPASTRHGASWKPGSEGYFGVLANHAARVTGLAEGTLEVRDAEGATQIWPVRGGCLGVSHTKATVLADSVG